MLFVPNPCLLVHLVAHGARSVKPYFVILPRHGQCKICTSDMQLKIFPKNAQITGSDHHIQISTKKKVDEKSGPSYLKDG